MSDDVCGNGTERLFCFFGRHDYRWIRNVGDESEIQCSRCDTAKFVPRFTPDVVKELDEWSGVDCNEQTGAEHVEVWLHFDGHHGGGLEFIEAETTDGESINLGEWDIGSGGSTLKFEVPERCVNTGGDQNE